MTGQTEGPRRTIAGWQGQAAQALRAGWGRFRFWIGSRLAPLPDRRLLPAALLAALGLAALYLAGGRQVQLVVDGEASLVTTHASTARAVLAQAGIAATDADWVWPGLDEKLAWTAGSLPAVVIDHARPVLLSDGDQHQLVESPETVATNLLALSEWMMYPGDRLELDGLPRGALPTQQAGYSVRLDRAVRITLDDGGRQQLIYSAAPTLGAALAGAGIELYQGDRLTPAPDSPLAGPVTVRLQRSQPLEIEIGSSVLYTRSAAGTLAEALAEAGLGLEGLDYTVPAADGPLPADGKVRVVRVQETVTLEQEPIAFEIRYQPLDNLELDQRQLIEAGSYGVQTNRIRVRFEDGQEVSRTVEGEWTAQEPAPQIIGYGTQIVVRSVSTADGTLDYWRAVQMYATSYSPSRAGVSPSSPWFGITASGKPLKKGLVAIDRSLIPFGTRMYVPGYGFAEAADTGGGVKGRWIDLGYSDDNWVSWSGYVTVYFLTPVPSTIVYLFPQ